MISEDLDLAAVADELRESVGMLPPVGYLRGKSLMRDALVERLGLSLLEAEELVDTLEQRGFLHFLGKPSERPVVGMPWKIESSRKA